MFEWIEKNWSNIDAAVKGVIEFLGAILGKFAEWPLFKVEI